MWRKCANSKLSNPSLAKCLRIYWQDRIGYEGHLPGYEMLGNTWRYTRRLNIDISGHYIHKRAGMIKRVQLRGLRPNLRQAFPLPARAVWDWLFLDLVRGSKPPNLHLLAMTFKGFDIQYTYYFTCADNLGCTPNHGWSKKDCLIEWAARKGSDRKSSSCLAHEGFAQAFRSFHCLIHFDSQTINILSAFLGLYKSSRKAGCLSIHNRRPWQEGHWLVEQDDL